MRKLWSELDQQDKQDATLLAFLIPLAIGLLFLPEILVWFGVLS